MPAATALPQKARVAPRFAATLAKELLLGLFIATLLMLLLLFAGSEDRGFIYVDF